MGKRKIPTPHGEVLSTEKPVSFDSFEKMSWSILPVAKSEVNLQFLLKCGQSFRWTLYRESPVPEWIGVLDGKLFVLSQTDEQLLYKVLPEQTDTESSENFLKDYFQLKIELGPLYKAWASVDPVFNEISRQYSGIRMLRQDPVENLFSFICSSNNNIGRISGMVENLCTHYGRKVCDFEGKSYHAFPSVQALAKDEVEAKLRTLGFGYRAGYISKTAKQIVANGGESHLHDLRHKSYDEARKELLKFTGIGPKVADCILLMSLDQPASIPVDTHMFQIAANQYLPHLKSYKSVTDKVYLEISNHFQNLYGDHAGWAHSVLFSADLKHLKKVGLEEPESQIPTKKKKTTKKSCSQ